MVSQAWKQNILGGCVFIWIATFLLASQRSDYSAFRVPRPLPLATNSLGPPRPLDHASANQNEDKLELNEQAYNFGRAKKILFFTNYFHLTDWQFGFGNQPFHDHGCPVTNCYTTKNRSLLGSLSDFDAIMFHPRDMHSGKIALPSPKKRKPGQRYVMFLMESPANSGDFPYRKFNKFFNWTMTFRRDSDFTRPYGWVAPKELGWYYPPGENYRISWKDPDSLPADSPSVRKARENLNSGNRKMVAWMVSNCHTHSQREHYVAELKKHVPVDIYGGCGHLKCKRNEADGDKTCLNLLGEKYLFYLSFENSLCKDYVTEKFWNALGLDLVPVVLGGANYPEIAPPKSYINARDFDSPAELAEYLKYLVGNETAYAEYFRWKDHYTLYNNPEQYSSRAICKLCEALNDDSREEYPDKVIRNLDDWWISRAKCQSKGSYPWSRPEQTQSWSSLLMDGSKTLLNSLRDAKVIV